MCREFVETGVFVEIVEMGRAGLGLGHEMGGLEYQIGDEKAV
jgi:hypothetical protein